MKVKCKADNGTEFEIELTREQEEQFCKAQKNEFEIDYENNGYLTYSDGHIISSTSSATDRIKNGSYRKTEKLAQRKLKEDQERNRLAELRDWLDPKWEADWKDKSQDKWYIYYNYIDDNFGIGWRTTTKYPGTVYMSEQTAMKICNELNNPTCEQTKELSKILKGI